MKKKFDFLRETTYYKSGNLSFRLGIFFLVSAPSISTIFFFISLLISTYNNYKNFLHDKWNYPFMLAGFILILTVSLSSLDFFSIDIEGWENYLNWISLFNWLPLFFCIWAFKPFLNSSDLRRKVLLILLCGSVPLMVSGYLQVFFDINGPFKILNGLIIWYQRADQQVLTGLFNNRNYASSWFTILWPVCLALLSQRKSKNKIYKKLAIYVFSISIITSLYLTFSRNGLLNFFLSTIIFLKSSLSIWLLLILILLVTLLVAAKTNIFPSSFQDLAIKILPNEILSRFTSIENIDNIYNSPRFLIWLNAIDFIKERPLLGWGAASFPLLFKSKNDVCCTKVYGQWFGHTHNLQIEMAYNYGLLFSFIVNITLLYIFYKSFKKIFITKNRISNIKVNNLNKFEKAWWISSFSLFFSQLFDFQYYDFRISIIFWIFISGLICKLHESSQEILKSEKDY